MLQNTPCTMQHSTPAASGHPALQAVFGHRLTADKFEMHVQTEKPLYVTVQRVVHVIVNMALDRQVTQHHCPPTCSAVNLQASLAAGSFQCCACCGAGGHRTPAVGAWAAAAAGAPVPCL
jgi:hypothetical protein